MSDLLEALYRGDRTGVDRYELVKLALEHGAAA